MELGGMGKRGRKETVIRTIAKHLPHPLLCRLYHHVRLHEESARARKVAALTNLPLLESLDLRSLKGSETLFVLGSAWSINDIPDEKWNIIARHDSLGLNFWPAHPFVPKFFHFENLSYDERPVMFDAFRLLMERRAASYANTVKIITDLAPAGLRQIVFELPEGMKNNAYLGFALPIVARNEEELRAGIMYMNSLGAFSPNANVAWLFKSSGSVTAAMTLAVLIGYKRIVLCGVDLNNQDYFYHLRDRYPEYADWEFASRAEPHLSTRRLPWLVPAQSAVYLFKEMILDPAGIELFVESRASTLYPRVPLASQALFEELACQSPHLPALLS